MHYSPEELLSMHKDDSGNASPLACSSTSYLEPIPEQLLEPGQ